jgi:hypothetical protein
MGPNPINAILDALPRYNDKQKSNQTTKPRKTAKGSNKVQRRTTTLEEHKKGERLSPLGGCLIPGPKEQEWLFARH